MRKVQRLFYYFINIEIYYILCYSFLLELLAREVVVPVLAGRICYQPVRPVRTK